MLENQKIQKPVLVEDLGMMYSNETSTVKYRHGIFKCQCGVKFRVQTRSIKSGHTKSCGCLKNEQRTTHGLHKHPLYKIWYDMIRRTTTDKSTDFKYYGGKGIRVCERWMVINNFIEDMYPTYQEGLTIDRINNDGNYEPSNCRWATKATQARNSRLLKSTNKSGYRGVYFSKRLKKWISQITINSQRVYLGCYKTPLEAAKTYDKYVKENNYDHTVNGVLL